MAEINPKKEKEYVRPDVINFDDIAKMVPKLAEHPGLVNNILRFLKIDEVNEVHGRWCHDTGVDFASHLVEDEFKFDLRVDNEEVLSQFPSEPFITVSNHPFGGMDGIILLHIVGKYRPDYKVMVNFFLNNIRAMRPSFIAVDPIKGDDDPVKKKITLDGIRAAIKQVKEGHPLGFFPAGAVSKLDRSLHIRDRQWQPSVIRLIQQLKVPVIPIFFHGHNSTVFNLLGLIDWRLRSLRLPTELFRMREKKVRVSVGQPIPKEKIAEFSDINELSDFLRNKTYSLK